MNGKLRPKLVTAQIDGGDIVICGDGVELFRMTVRQSVWLIARIAEEIAGKRP